MFANVSRKELEAALPNLEALKSQLLAENKLAAYQPYDVQRRFHDAGATHRERLFMAGNRVGKTVCGTAEVAYHLAGNYPEWWTGKRFAKPVRAWVAGV